MHDLIGFAIIKKFDDSILFVIVSYLYFIASFIFYKTSCDCQIVKPAAAGLILGK